jgi:hypothetical protein
MFKTGEIIGGLFGISDPETAGLIAPDALPTAELRINGVVSAATVTVAATATTGKYTWSVTLPAIADGTVLEIWVSATVATVVAGGVVWSGLGVTKRPADVFAAVIGTGTGPVAVTITVDDGTNPVPNAQVTAYDAGVASGQGTTDANGEVVLNLAAGTYDVVIYHAGYTSGEETLTVPDDGDPTYSIAAIAPTGSVDPDWANCYADVYDEDGVLEANVVCSLRISKEPSGSGQIFGGAATEETSDANGRVHWDNRPVGCQVEYWRGPADQDPKRIKRATIAAADVVGGVFWLPRIVGHEEAA